MVNSLREKDGLLFSRDSMTRYCQQRPEAEMVGNYCTEYGFKLKTDHHTYMLRCNPIYHHLCKGDFDPDYRLIQNGSLGVGRLRPAPDFAGKEVFRCPITG